MLRTFIFLMTLLVATNAQALQATVVRTFDVRSSFESVLDFAVKNRNYIFEDTSGRSRVVAIHPTTTTVAVKVLRREVLLTYKTNFALYDNYAMIKFRQIGASSRFANGSSFKLELWRIGPSHSRIRVHIWVDAGFRWHVYSRRLAAHLNGQIQNIANRVKYLEGVRRSRITQIKKERVSGRLIIESVLYHIATGIYKEIVDGNDP